jgi:hypothetical protein
MYRYFYIGERKPGGSLKELSAMVENELQGSAFYLGEVCIDCSSDIEELEQDQSFQANVAFLISQKFSLKIMRRVLLSRKIPTAILSFDTPTTPDEMLSPLPGQTHSNFIDRFKAEADFIGYFCLPFAPEMAATPRDLN